MGEISYPSKSRSIAKPYPGKSRSIGVADYIGRARPSRKAKDGKPPKKGVLLKGGGHG